MGARASSAKSAALAAVLIIATAPGVAMALPPTPAAPTAAAPTAPAGNAAASTWIGTAEVESKERYGSAADGDLWPTCWADDGHLYSAWGDGKGFDLEGRFYDIGVARISGDADALQGENLALGDDVAKLWHGTGYTRKPTGMVCVGSTLYLAVQDLSTTFDDAPVATIVKSTDGGMTWQSDGDEPMFSDHVFTTIWFADFGRGGEWAPDGYVYAYGLDGNWRDSYRNTVEDPVDVYLARVPEDRVADRSAWAFFAGMKSNGKGPTWSKKIKDRRPVLHDDRRVYQEMFDPALRNDLTVLSQGHVLYNEPLARYIYSSWSEYTHHFYESPTPWGPWSRMADRDYTSLNLEPEQYGGYGTVLPSKFLSDDGRTMLLQSNVCCSAPDDSPSYHYSLRKFEIAPLQDGGPDNSVSGENLARAADAVPISKSVRQPGLDALRDGSTDISLDDKDGEVKTTSWWGYTWPRTLNLNRVGYTTGDITSDGGWFVARPKVQVRQDGRWIDVPGQATTPKFTGEEGGPKQTYVVTFPTVEADGVRVIGSPGGNRRYSSMSEVTVYNQVQVVDGGFENSFDYGPIWSFEGSAGHGFDGGAFLAHSGERNAWIRTQETLGKQYLTQRVSVQPGSTVELSAWFRTSPAVERVFLGAAWDGGEKLDTFDGGVPDEYTRRTATIDVPDDVHEVTILVGYGADGGDAILQVDDVELTKK